MIRTLDNLALNIGPGVSPFEPRVREHSRLQAIILMELRHPLTDDEMGQGILERETELADMRVAYLEGEIDVPEGGDEEDPLDYVMSMQ